MLWKYLGKSTNSTFMKSADDIKLANPTFIINDNESGSQIQQ